MYGYFCSTETCQRCLSRSRRKPDHYRKGGVCNFWFRHSKNKTYSCTKIYLSSSCRVWENTQKKSGFQHRKVMLQLCSCSSSSSVVPNVILELTHAKKKKMLALQMRKTGIKLLTPEIYFVYHSQR